MVWRRLQAEAARGRAYQPRFEHHEVLGAWLGGLLAITALGQALRCLHPPAGAVALLGVLLHARVGFVLMPILSGSLVLVVLAVLFNRLRSPLEPYPHHWL